MQCPNCKAQLPEAVKLCTSCGAKLDVRLCPNGHVLEPGEQRCRYCPPPEVMNTRRMSVSTTIEKLTRVEQPPGKMTVVEGIQPAAFNKTVIFPDAASASKDNSPAVLFGWLVLVQGKNQWKDFPIRKTKISLGRAPECDIVLDDEHLSGKHASLKLVDNAWHLTDLDSGNGTFVNEKEISRVQLSDNDIIKAGNTILKFKLF